MSAPREPRRQALFAAVGEPPSRSRLDLAGVTTVLGLSRAVVVAVWPWALGGALLITLVGLGRTLVPWWLGQLLDRVIAPAADGASAAATWQALLAGCGVLGGIYVVITLPFGQRHDA